MVEIGIGDNCPDFNKPASEWTNEELNWVRWTAFEKVPEAEQEVNEIKEKLQSEKDEDEIEVLKEELEEWEGNLAFAKEMQNKAREEILRRGKEKGFGFLF